MGGHDTFDSVEFALNHVPGCVSTCQVMPDGAIRLLYASSGIAMLVGYSAEEFNRLFASDLRMAMDPGDIESVSHCLHEVIAAQKAGDVSFRIIRKDGSPIWVHIALQSSGELDGCPLITGMMVSHTTIDGTRHDAERERRKVSLALEQSGMIMWEYDTTTWAVTRLSNRLPNLKIPRVVPNLSEWLIERGRIADESLRPLKRFRERICSGEKRVDADVKFLHMDGSPMWLRLHYELFDEYDGIPIALGCARDITEETEVHRHYEEEVAQLGVINNALFLRASHVNLQTNVILDYYADDNMLIHGKPAGFDALATAIEGNCIDKDDRATVHEIFNRDRLIEMYQLGRTSESAEYRISMRDNSICWVHTDMNLYTMPGNDDVRALVSTRDVTSEKLLNSIIEHLVETGYDYLAVADRRSNMLQYPIACRPMDLFLDPERIETPVGEAVEWIVQFVVPESRDEARATMALENVTAKLMEGVDRYSVSFDVIIDNRRRSKTWDFLFLDSDCQRILCTCIDTTELFRQQREQTEVLHQALSDAKKATRAKTLFLAQMSHDIRTPLNAILGSSELMKKSPERAEEYIDTIHNSGMYLLELINDILDVSKSESDGLTLNPKPFSALEFTGKIAEVIQPVMDEKHIEFTMDMGSATKYALVDGHRLSQLFYNLLSNAAKYTPEGGHVSFTLEHLGMRGQMALTRFVVEDDGIGMSDDFQKHLFAPFSREHENEEGAFEWKGTGLGLTIAKHIVDAMDGTITVESTPGKGSRFIVDIAILPLNGDVAYNDEEARKHVDTSVLKGKSALLADDNAINITLAKQMLENADMIVTTVSNGQQAVDLFVKSQPGDFDIILLDLQMPVMGGLQAARTIRALERDDAAVMPIAAMTANAFDEDRQAVFDAGMQAHITKPLSQQSLLDTIAGLCS